MIEQAAPTGQHGGKREGAGRPKVKDSGVYARIAELKAKTMEVTLKDKHLEFLKKQGKVYDKDEIDRTVSEMIAVFVDICRSLPDQLERDAGLTPAQAEKAEDIINENLELMRENLKKMTANE